MKLLFITHNSSRAGAPLVLLQLLQWLKKTKPQYEVHVLDLNPGVLAKDFESCSTFYYCLGRKASSSSSLLQKAQRRLQLGDKMQHTDALLKQLGAEQFSVIYSNTVKASTYGVALKALSPTSKHIVHVHELPTVIGLLVPDFSNYVRDIDHFVGVSELVCEGLCTTYSISKPSVSCVYEFSSVTIPTNPTKDEGLVSFCIGASGFVDWRKGADVFIQVARYLKKRHPDCAIRFVWVGHISPQDSIIMEADIRKLGLTDNVLFTGALERPFETYMAFDVFLLPSREDPFPLVCIEMGMLGIPMVCFENATGTAEILKQGGGMIVPYLDVEAMAEAVMTYYKSPQIRQQDGEAAKNLFSNFTTAAQCPKLLAVIENCLAR